MAKKGELVIEPTGDRIVVEPIESDDYQGKMIIPEMAKEKPTTGEIVACGEGRYSEHGNRIPMRLRVGDRVLFGKFSGTEITVNGKPVLLMREADVLARLRED